MVVPLYPLAILLGNITIKNASAFAPTPLTRPIQLQKKAFPSYQINNDDEEPELIESLIDSNTEEEDLLKFEMKFTEEEIDELRTKLQQTVVDASIDADLAEIEKLRSQLAEEAVASKQRISDARALNVQYERQNLLERIDNLSEEFLGSTRQFRETTKKIAEADRVAGTSGRGVDWGSWGTVGGLDVIMSDGRDMPSRLLGSVDSARRRGEMGDEVQTVVSGNRILVVSDEQKVNISIDIDMLCYCFGK